VGDGVGAAVGHVVSCGTRNNQGASLHGIPYFNIISIQNFKKTKKFKKMFTFSLHLPSPTTLGLAHQSH